MSDLIAKIRSAQIRADDLNAMTGGPTLDDAASVIRMQHAEIERMTKQNSAYATLVKWTSIGMRSLPLIRKFTQRKNDVQNT